MLLNERNQDYCQRIQLRTRQIKRRPADAKPQTVLELRHYQMVLPYGVDLTLIPIPNQKTPTKNHKGLGDFQL